MFYLFQISDWQFPYKQSHHPVCVHGDRKHASVKLRNCDPGVQPGTDVYHYVEATSCKCQVRKVHKLILLPRIFQNRLYIPFGRANSRWVLIITHCSTEQ